MNNINNQLNNYLKQNNLNIEAVQRLALKPIMKLVQSDKNLAMQIQKSPQSAEVLLRDKLKKIGLDDKEIELTILDMQNIPMANVVQQTGWEESELNKVFDSAQSKINSSLSGGYSLGNIFKK